MKELTLIDVCLPDYFRGHSNETIAIPVDGSITIGEVIKGIESECNMLELTKYSGFTEAELDAALIHLKTRHCMELNDRAFPDLESYNENEDYIDSVYAYFTVT